MNNLALVLLAFAFVCFAFAAWREEADRSKFICIGLAFWVAAEIFGGLVKLFTH